MFSYGKNIRFSTIKKELKISKFIKQTTSVSEKTLKLASFRSIRYVVVSWSVSDEAHW